MSFKLTEITEYSPLVLPKSVICGSGILSRLASLWSMASSGHFDPSQTYDGYKAPCCPSGHPASNIRRYLWSKKDAPFGKEFPVAEAPTPDGTSGYSNSSDELDGEEVEVVHNSIGHQSSISPSHSTAKKFQSQIIPSASITFQPTLATIPTSLPPASPSSSTTRPGLILEVRPSPIHQSRNSPKVTSQQIQPVARDHWPIKVSREDSNTISEDQDAVARLFRRVDRKCREVIEYANDRTITGTASEEIAAKHSWYEEELTNDFQRTFDHFGRDN
ncbi:hypothetical protein O181_105699 [Austropuccinia psidii MF-1]|uniref:Uncharacterized protein n=1 Tax=Austropuccinia psidii MF-1 TaxID=1389203 RepID=A0A9Q3PLC2_9BASI|nr:hypothetical protein [Austropuccinia psidii MF-1]